MRKEGWRMNRNKFSNIQGIKKSHSKFQKPIQLLSSFRPLRQLVSEDKTLGVDPHFICTSFIVHHRICLSKKNLFAFRIEVPSFKSLSQIMIFFE